MPKAAQDVNLRYMVGASNKAFDYMACGVSLLVSDLPDWTAMFVKPGYALACDPDDPDSIETALRWYLDHPEERRVMRLKAQRKIRDAWNYDNVCAPLLAALEHG
jgi:spore maturation protein CgeB